MMTKDELKKKYQGEWANNVTLEWLYTPPNMDPHLLGELPEDLKSMGYEGVVIETEIIETTNSIIHNIIADINALSPIILLKEVFYDDFKNFI